MGVAKARRIAERVHRGQLYAGGLFVLPRRHRPALVTRVPCQLGDSHGEGVTRTDGHDVAL